MLSGELNEQDASSSTPPEMTEILAMVDELELTASELSSMPGPVSVDGLISHSSATTPARRTQEAVKRTAFQRRLPNEFPLARLERTACHPFLRRRQVGSGRS